MRVFTVILVFMFSLNVLAQADQKSLYINENESSVSFIAIGKPSLLKINGTGGKLKGLVEISARKVAGNFTVNLSDLTTGISLRDEHMKDKYLEIKKFPEASLKIAELSIDKDLLKENATLKEIPFKGLLKIHGAEKEITGNADIESNKDLINVVAKTKTAISSHQIDLPSYMGIKVADEVQISVQFQIKKN